MKGRKENNIHHSKHKVLRFQDIFPSINNYIFYSYLPLAIISPPNSRRKRSLSISKWKMFGDSVI